MIDTLPSDSAYLSHPKFLVYRIMIVIRNFIYSLLAASLCGCGLVPAKPFHFELKGTGENEVALVKLQRGVGAPSLLLTSFDGADPKSSDAMKDYVPAFPQSRYEPRLFSVSPGPHKYGVLFMFKDVRGVLATSEIASEMLKKYPTEDSTTKTGNNSNYVTIKHYEELSFVAESAKKYSIQYVWLKSEADLHLAVQQCSDDWATCTPIAFDSTNVQTKVLPGMSISDQDL